MPTKYKSLTDIPYKARPAAGQAARGRAIKKLQGLDYKIVRVKRGRRTISLGVHPIEEAPAAVKAYRLENRGQAFQVLFLDPISKQDIARTYFAAGSTQIPESLTLKMAERYRLGGDVLIYIIIFETKATTKAAKKPAKKAAKKPAKKAAKKPAKKAAKKPAKKAAKKPVKKAAKKPVKKAAKKPAKKTMEQFGKQNSEIKTPIPAYGYSYAPYEPEEAFLKRRK